MRIDTTIANTHYVDDTAYSLPEKKSIELTAYEKDTLNKFIARTPFNPNDPLALAAKEIIERIANV